MKKVFSQLFVFSVLTLFGSMPALAVEITDSADVIKRLIDYGGQAQSFEDAFKCGDKASFKGETQDCSFNCNDQYCQSQCNLYRTEAEKHNRFYVEDCTPDKVHIYTDKGLDYLISKDEFEKDNGTWIRTFIRQIGHYIKPDVRVDLSFLFPRTYEIIEGGRKNTIRAYEIHADIWDGQSKQREKIMLVVDPTRKGVEQILVLKNGFEADAHFLKLNGFIDKL